jgi:hypothetical protein
MMLETMAIISLLLAGISCALFMANLLVYRDPGASKRSPGARHPAGTADLVPPGGDSVSVLIPARNEEANIGATLAAVLASRGVDFEVIVLDDQSTDRTADIVAEFARRDSRVRLETAPALRPGWCGKQHACHVLAGLARHPLLVFIDADVRLAPDALERMKTQLETGGADLASGVPRQELGSFSERLLIPLIHFILLGFLPMHWAGRSRRPAFAAGCGQLFIARAEAYHQVGGHAAIRASLHDGVKLPRAFRAAGFRTALFDATHLAACRMYRTNLEVWRGLGKNASEGLAAPGTILPMTLLLFGGQVLPLALLAGLALTGTNLNTTTMGLAGFAVIMSYLPRLISIRRFRQPPGAALLHPLGVLCLLAIQWFAFAKSLAGRPSVWKGRSYAPSHLAMAASGAKTGVES